MRVHRVLPVGVCVLLAAAVVFAGSNPVAVSPGDASKLVLIADPCPTFSWGAVEGAMGHELVVYRLGDLPEETTPILRQSFSGSIDSWTPSLASCLDRGGRYAWSVRATHAREGSDWSSPNLFQVASGPTLGEVEEALALVREFVQAGEKSRAGGPASVATPFSGEAGGSRGISRAVPSAAPPVGSGVVIVDDRIWIDGNQVVTIADLPTCRRVGELLWCWDDLACGEACEDVCSAVGLVPIASDAEWFAAQNTLDECTAISVAFGLGATPELSNWSYACLEDQYGTHSIGGGLLAPLRCTTDSNCPSRHRTDMDSLGVQCGVNSRRSICPCESAS